MVAKKKIKRTLISASTKDCAKNRFRWILIFLLNLKQKCKCSMFALKLYGDFIEMK